MPIAGEMAFATLRVLGNKLRAREFTAVELAEFFLQRLGKLGPRFNAVVTLTRDLALQQARRADQELQAGMDRGPLHGIPYGAKDLLATKGIPTTWGAAPFKERILDEDATIIRKLHDAGAVLVAKLAMVEIAGGLGYKQANASFTGPGLCAWDDKSWAGGSSSGSGSAVGAGMVPFAIGSETWGSIVTPAGYCGVTGLRPTYGRVSRHGAMALSWTMDKLGVLGRCADDCGLVLQAMAGPDPQDPTAVARSYKYPDPQTLTPPFKLAQIRGAADKCQPEVRQNYQASLGVLSKLASITEIDLPDLPYGAVASTIISCEMAAAFEHLVDSGEIWKMAAPEDRVGLHGSLLIPAKDYINAFRIRRKIQVALDEILTKYDAIVAPALATVAPPIDRDFGEYQKGHTAGPLGGASNVAGVPAICVPNGLGERGLPTSIQLVGRAFEENRLLAIARAYQAATTWHEKHPPL